MYPYQIGPHPKKGQSMDFSVRTIRLDSSPREGGLWCGPEGLTLAGHPLLEKTENGFAPAALPEIQRTFDHVFGETAPYDASIYLGGLSSVARSLNKGDLPLAMIGSVLLKLPDLPQAAPKRKLAFDDTQPRNDNGRWTSGVREEAKSPITIQAEATAGVEETAARLAPRVLMLLGRLARVLPGPVALAAGVLIPTNDSNIHSGEFPGFQGLHYRSDEGVVTISRLNAAGNIETLYRGFPDANGFYRDDKGLIIGRNVGTAVLFDNESLSDLTAKSPETATETPPPTPETTPDQDDDEPKVCPAPTTENTAGRSARSLAYQTQITGLPEGWDVLYHGVRYDGCDDLTKDMEEAKSRMGGYLVNLSDDELRESKYYYKTMDQARRQSEAATDRDVDWYFAEKRFSDFFEGEFVKYPNIHVHQEDPVMKIFLDWMTALTRSEKHPTTLKYH
jgi:hypothetical protein